MTIKQLKAAVSSRYCSQVTIYCSVTENDGEYFQVSKAEARRAIDFMLKRNTLETEVKVASPTAGPEGSKFFNIHIN